MKRFLNLIDGRLRASETGQWIDCVDPARGVVFAQVPRSSVEDAQLAISAASSAFDGPWSRMARVERARLLRKLAELFERNFEELLDLETRDVGRAIKESRTAILPAAVEALYYYAGLADKLHGETIAVSPSSFNYTIVEPLGVVGLILPYNAPLLLFASKLGAALAAGNTIVAKPSEHASCSCLRFAELVAEAGFPSGVVNVISGTGSEAGNEIVSHPVVSKIGFTGSVAAAQKMSIAGAAQVKQFQFELGGKSPHVVFADADLAAAIPVVVRGIMTGSAGQTCVAGSRILIQRSIWDQTVEAILAEVGRLQVGDPADPATDLGPLCFQDHFTNVGRFVGDSIAAGDKLLIGGGDARKRFAEDSPLRGGFFFEPTLLSYADQSARLCREEIFGPVGALIPFDTEEDAITLCNDSEFALGAGLWTRDLQRALRFVQRVQSGNIWVNAYRRQHWAVPFGGFKLSGFGKDFGPDAVAEFQQKKAVWMQID